MDKKHIPELLKMYENKDGILARIAKIIFPNASKNEMQQQLSKLDEDFSTVFHASLLYYEKGSYEEIKSEKILLSCKKYISRTKIGANAQKINKPEELLISDLIEALFYIRDDIVPAEINEITTIGATILVDILNTRTAKIGIIPIYDDILARAERKLTTTDRSNEKEKNRYNQRTREFYRKLQKELSKLINKLNNGFIINENDVVEKFNISLKSIREGQEWGELKDLEKMENLQTKTFGKEGYETAKSPEIEETRFSKYIDEFRLLFKVLQNRHHQMEKDIITKENGEKNKNLNSKNYYNMQKLNYSYSYDFKRAFESIRKTEPQNYERLYFKKESDIDLKTMHDWVIELITEINNEFEGSTENRLTKKNNTGKYLMEIIFCLNFFKIEWIKALHAVAFQYNPEISQTALKMKSYLSIKPEEIPTITELFPDYGKKSFLIDESGLFKKTFLENLNRYRNAFDKKLQEMLKMEKEDKQGLQSEGVK